MRAKYLSFPAVIAAALLASIHTTGCDPVPPEPTASPTPAPPAESPKAPSAAVSPTPVAPPKPTGFAARVKPAKGEWTKAIQTGIEKGVTLGAAYMVKANGFKNVYYVAGKLKGPGFTGNGSTAVWAVGAGNAEIGTSFIWSADALAASFSDWPRGESHDAWITDQDAADLVKYVDSK